MPDGKYQNNNLIVVNFGKQTIIPDTVPPLSATICGQSFSVLPRIFTVHKIFFNPSENQCPRLFVQLF